MEQDDQPDMPASPSREVPASDAGLGTMPIHMGGARAGQHASEAAAENPIAGVGVTRVGDRCARGTVKTLTNNLPCAGESHEE